MGVNDDGFKIHEVKWTNNKVGAFWDYMSKKENSIYFAQEVGEAVLRLSAQYISLHGDILDYGTGNGYLIKYLLDMDNKAVVTGCDFSRNSVDRVNSDFSRNDRFGGCKLITELPSDLPSNQFNIVFCLETVEHLIDNQFENTMHEIVRILKPGGYVIITTPNDEKLSLQNVICPDCGAVFHRVQHVNTFTEQSLEVIMNNYGFSKVTVRSLDLYDYKKRSFLKKTIRKIIHAASLKSKSKPNLVYIGKKNGY